MPTGLIDRGSTAAGTPDTEPEPDVNVIQGLRGPSERHVNQVFDDSGAFDGNQQSGPFDVVRGSADEAVARTFDDEPGGGFGDPDTVESAADDLAGSADETVGRETPDIDVPEGAAQAASDVFDFPVWVARNQEIVAIVLVVLAFAWATQGTVGTGFDPREASS